MNKLFGRFIILITIVFSLLIFAGAVNIHVSIDNSPLASDVSPQLIGSVTYIPLKAFSQALNNCTISWNQNTRIAMVTGVGMTMQVTAGEKYLNANERYLYLGQPAIIQNGRVLVPIRAVAKAFNATVNWDAKTRTAHVKRGDGTISSGQSFYKENDVYWLSRIIHAESQGEPLDGMIAVGNVILNRVKSPQFPNNIYDVIFDTHFGVQFTPTSNKTIYNTPSATSIIAAKIALEGYQVVPGALYFLNEAKATSLWIKENCQFVMAIGHHDFYR